MINIYEKISDWLKDCPEMGDYIYFNVIPLDENTSSVNSNPSSIISNTFLDGSKEVRLLFNINLIKSYDNGGTSDLNLDAINVFDSITKYIEDKNNNNDYPNLGNNFVVNDIGANYKAPEVYITEDNPSIARYEGQFYIEYLQRKEG